MKTTKIMLTILCCPFCWAR